MAMPPSFNAWGAEGAASTARTAEPVKGAMEAMFARDGLAMPAWKPDGSLEL
jgi:hypothetical protein